MFRKRRYFSHVAIIIVLTVVIVGVGCQSLQPSPSPSRDFTTSDLLINKESLPEKWEVKIRSIDNSPNDLGFRNNLGGSTIEFGSATSSAEHIVARFENAQRARQAYADHDLTRNTEGEYAATNEPLPNFGYRSPVADQFRVTCTTINNVTKVGESCAIEAQYEEFFSVLLYDTTTAELAIDDLEILAKAIDLEMSKYLENE